MSKNLTEPMKRFLDLRIAQISESRNGVANTYLKNTDQYLATLRIMGFDVGPYQARLNKEAERLDSV
jgi:hypothetical protein